MDGARSEHVGRFQGRSRRWNQQSTGPNQPDEQLDQGRQLSYRTPAGRVAAVDTHTWQVVANLDVGPRPRRLGLQPDEAYL